MRGFCSTALLPFLLGAVLLMAVGGCEDKVDICGPQVPVGVIQGQVRTGGLPVDGEVRAIRIEEDPLPPTNFRTTLEESGAFSFGLPAGQYVVQLRFNGSGNYYDYTSSGPGYGQIPADTLLVDGAHSHTGIDFDLGGVTLQLELSDRLDGEEGEVVLHRRDPVEKGLAKSLVESGRAIIENGRLEISLPGVLPGDYQVEIVLGSRQYDCYCPYDGEHFWMPGTRDPDQSPWYAVAVDSVVALETRITAEPARIEGRVSGAWLEMGLEYEPELAIFSPDSILVMGPRRVESDGSFAVDVHIPGPVKLMVKQNGLEQWIGGPGFDDATVYELEFGQTIRDIELVQCGVHFLLDGVVPLTWATEFQFYDPTGGTLLGTWRFDSGSTYHVGIANLWTGDFLVYMTPDWGSRGWLPWRPQWWNRAPTPDQAQLVSLGTAGDIVRLDLSPEIGGTISGIVRLSNQADWPYYVHAVPVNDPGLEKTFRRGDYEGYEIRGLPDGGFKVGTLSIRVEFTGPETPGVIWYPGTSDWDQATVVEIRDAGHVVGIDFDVP